MEKAPLQIKQGDFAVTVSIPAGIHIGDIVDNFIIVAFRIVAELCGSGQVEGIGAGNPALELMRAENCLRAVWRAVQKGNVVFVDNDLEEMA